MTMACRLAVCRLAVCQPLLRCSYITQNGTAWVFLQIAISMVPGNIMEQCSVLLPLQWGAGLMLLMAYLMRNNMMMLMMMPSMGVPAGRQLLTCTEYYSVLLAAEQSCIAQRHEFVKVGRHFLRMTDS